MKKLALIGIITLVMGSANVFAEESKTFEIKIDLPDVIELGEKFELVLKSVDKAGNSVSDSEAIKLYISKFKDKQIFDLSLKKGKVTQEVILKSSGKHTVVVRRGTSVLLSDFIDVKRMKKDVAK